MAQNQSNLGSKRARVLLIDDRLSIRQGLCLFLQLEPGVMIIGEAATALEGLALAAVLRPDVVIMDVALPGMDGISATCSLLGQQPCCLVIILTIHGDSFTRARAKAAGAWDFVQKDRPEELRDALRRALAALAAGPE